MKTSSCHDPKMEAYCKEVRQLEDKFHGLELVHVARRYNEAADELTKIASTRSTVPPDVFSRDLHEPSVDLGSGAGVKASPAQQADNVEALLMAAEVMEVGQWPGRSFDWRTPFLDCLIRCELPEDRSEARRIAPSRLSFSSLTSSTGLGFPTSSSPTTALSSPAKSSWTSAISITSV